MVYFGTRLSENISRREPEGYLICLNVPVARTGTQEYLPSELGLPGMDDRMIPVERTAEEVFSAACMASFEGMPVTDDHPAAAEGVTAENIRYLQKGHAMNIRRGPPPEDDLLMADLIITDPRLIEEILGGKREISCGYNYVLSEEDGKYYQREIRGNHVAVVDAGRAGPRVCIKDADYKGGKHSMNRKNKVFAKLMARMAKDGDTEALEEVIAEIMGEEPETVAAAVNEQGNAAGGTAPAAPVVVETPVEQPVIIDCGPEILEALRRIIELLGGNAADCGNTEKQTDEDPDAIESSVGVAAAEAAEAVAETVEATAEAVAQTVAEAMGMESVGEDPLTDDDPIEEMIQEILEGTAEPEEAGTEEILSTILEPEEEADADPEEKVSEQATDLLRAALSTFTPQIRKMSQDERTAFNASVSEKMRSLARKNKGKNAYAALRDAVARDHSGRALGEKIMKERNANRRV